MALKKSEKKMLKILAGVAVFGAFMLYRTYKSEPEVVVEEEVEATATPTAKSSTAKASGGGGGRKKSDTKKITSIIQMNEFQKHNKETDCWVLISGEVYDINNFITKYPEQGQSAKEFCGTIGFEAGFLEENSIRDTIKINSENLGKISQ